MGKSVSGTLVWPDVTIRATGGQRFRITRANRIPSMVPGIWTSGEDGPDVAPALQEPDGFVSIGRCNGLESGLFHHGHCIHAD
jgi:hypothetical protein